MGNVSPDEKDMEAMTGRWLALDAVEARETALLDYLLAEVPGATGPDGMTAMLQAVLRFNGAWPFKVPSKWEMVLADRAGQLDQFTEAANLEFAVDKLEWDVESFHT